MVPNTASTVSGLPAIAGMPGSEGDCPRQGIQRLDQEVRGKWFKEKTDTARFQRTLLDCLMVIPGHEYYGKAYAELVKPTHKLDAADLPQLNIDNEAKRLSGRYRIQEFAGRNIQLGIESLDRQQAARGFEDARVIVDNCNNWTLRGHNNWSAMQVSGFAARHCGEPEGRRLEEGDFPEDGFICPMCRVVLLSCAKTLLAQASTGSGYRARSPRA